MPVPVCDTPKTPMARAPAAWLLPYTVTVSVAVAPPPISPFIAVFAVPARPVEVRVAGTRIVPIHGERRRGDRHRCLLGDDPGNRRPRRREDPPPPERGTRVEGHGLWFVLTAHRHFPSRVSSPSGVVSVT